MNLSDKEYVEYLVKKWSKTGLLEGLKRSQNDTPMAILIPSAPMPLTPKKLTDELQCNTEEPVE